MSNSQNISIVDMRGHVEIVWWRGEKKEGRRCEDCKPDTCQMV